MNYQSRRWPVLLSVLLVLAFALSSCGGAATPAPAPMPTKAAEAAQPTAEPAPTQAPAEAAPTEAPTAAPAAPTEAPAAAAPAATGKYNEAPALAEQVKAGKLPAVEQRLPEQPLVVEAAEIGQYGGVWRRGFIGPSDFNNYVRVVYDALVRYNPAGNQWEPKVALKLEPSADYKTWTLTLRKGAKWSDGQPMNADDIMFWYKDVLQNKDLTPSPHKMWKNTDGSLVQVAKVDDYAITFTYNTAYTLFPNELANQDGGDRTYAPFLPAHYLKQFHPQYANQADIDKMVADAKFKTWVELFASRNAPFENPERPTMAAWVPATRISEQVFSLKRNPYYIGVDQAGNQLPYIDEVRFQFYADANTLNLAGIAGDLDEQDRHMNMMNYPVLKENELKAKYKVLTWTANGGADAVIMFNQTYAKDADLGKLMQTRDFRVALSYAIDRSQIQDAAFLGLGEPRNAVAPPTSPFYPGDEVAHKYTNFDLAQANQMLDSIGLDKKDSEGFRLYPNSSKRVQIEISVVAAFGPWPDVAQMVGKNWEQVGIKTIVQVRERSLHFQMRDSNDLQTELWNEDTGGFPFTGAPKFDPRTGGGGTGLTLCPLVRVWYNTDGKDGVEPTADLKKIVDLENAARSASPEEQAKIAKELYAHWVEQQYEIGIIGMSPMVQGVVVVNSQLGNVPEKLNNDWPLRTPGNGLTETWFFKQ
jgi:peptide/nickel transport system substrate-binding protein